MLTWDTNTKTLNFNITIGNGANGLLAMVPVTVSAGTLTGITLNGSAVAFTNQTIKGIAYALFSASARNLQSNVRSVTRLPIADCQLPIGLSSSKSVFGMMSPEHTDTT